MESSAGRVFACYNIHHGCRLPICMIMALLAIKQIMEVRISILGRSIDCVIMALIDNQPREKLWNIPKLIEQSTDSPTTTVNCWRSNSRVLARENTATFTKLSPISYLVINANLFKFVHKVCVIVFFSLSRRWLATKIVNFTWWAIITPRHTHTCPCEESGFLTVNLFDDNGQHMSPVREREVTTT